MNPLPRISIILPSLLLAVSALAQDANPAPADKIDPKDFEATLAPDKDIIMPGESLYVTLIIKNNSKRALLLWISDDWIDDKKLKPRNIKLTATSKEEVKLPEFNWEKSRGFGSNEESPYRPEKIPASGEYDFRVFVPYWVVFEQPGGYTLTAEARLVFSIPPGAGVDTSERNYPVPTMVYIRPMSSFGDNRPAVVDADKTAIAIPVTAISAIMVARPDKKKLDDITDALLKKVSAGENASLEAREAGKKLQFIPDERAIPWLAQKFKNDDPDTGTGADAKLPSNRWDAGGKYGGQLDALHALIKFNNDAALDTLKKGIETKEEGKEEFYVQPFRSTAANYLLRSAHPGAIPYLLTYIHDPDVSIRNVVLEAVDTKLPPEQALPLLQEMAAKDPSSQVKSWAQMYLQRTSKIIRLKQMGLPTPTPYPER